MITLHQNPYEYRRRLPHFQKADLPLFVTFRKLDREPLPSPARSLVLEHCLHDNGLRMMLHAAVIMPEHVHLLLTPFRDASGSQIPIWKIMKEIKGV